jgi:Ca-activated chloride channel homolog
MSPRPALPMLVGLCGAALLYVAAGAQTFRTGVNLVVLPVTVTNDRGQFVGSLGRGDFAVYEDGVQRPIEQFSAERVPVSLGILVDISGSMEGARFADARGALVKLLERFDDDDQIFLAVFNEKFRLLAPWTADHASLIASLSGVTPRGGTFLYSSVAAALPILNQGTNRKKALVIITDGDDTELPAGLNANLLTRAVAQAQGSEAVIYAIGIGPPKPPLEAFLNPATSRQLLYDPPVDVELLQRLTDPTGGYAQLVSSSSDLASTFIRIADDLSAQYVIGFESAKPPDGKFHAVKVTGSRTELRIRSRNGYVSAPQ